MAESAFSRISALDLSRLTETERQSATVEVRALLDAIDKGSKSDVHGIAQKLGLLKIWQKLVHLRVVDVARNVAPPREKPANGRLFPDSPLFEEDIIPAEEGFEVEFGETPHSDLVLVRIIKEGVVQGMRLPTGVTVETSIADATSLVESGLGMVIQSADVAPGEVVKITTKS